MQFTLDSIEHVKSVLQEKNKGLDVYYEPVILNNSELDTITQPHSKKYFFGIFTSGDLTKTKLIFENGSITIPEQNQIILLFKNVEFVVPENNNFQFRGFQISIS